MHSQAPAIQQHATPLVAKVAIGALALTTLVLGALYVQANRDIDSQKESVAGLQLALAREAAHAAELKSDLNASRADARTYAATSARLSAEVERKEQVLAAEKSKVESTQAALEQEKARLPPVPVRIETRRSIAGRGLVAMFTNTSALQLSVVIATRNPTSGAENEMSHQIAPGRKLEIGHLERVQFASGDQIRLRSSGFEELHYTVP